MENKNKQILLIVGILALLLVVGSATYAFFVAQGGASDIKDVNVTSATTDLLTFDISDNITVKATQTNLGMTGSNQSGSATATAMLTANSAAAAEQQQYYMYLVAEGENPFIYTKDSNTPELLLKLEYDTSGNGDYIEITNSNKGDYQGVVLEGLSYKTVNSGTTREISGWDITTETFVKIIENKAINAAKSKTTTDKYRVTVTFVNLVDQNQKGNAGKNFTAKLYMQKDVMSPPAKYWNDGFSYSADYAYPNTPDTTYGSIEELQAGYADFANKPFYIKTTDTEHQACLYYNNKEFCLGPNYWDTDEATTKAKLQTGMATAFGINESDLSCRSGSGIAYCNVSGFSCNAYSHGLVSCYDGSNNCYVYGGGTARCD